MLPSRRALSEAMPSTLKGTCRPVGVSRETVWPTFNLCDFAYSLATIVPLSSSASSVAFEPCFHSTRYTRPKVAGSIAVIEALLLLPCRRPMVKPTGVTTATPGTRRSAGATKAGIPASLPDWEFSTIRLPANERLTAWSIVALVPSASTATNVTSAKPTVSAAAVVSVRPGWRIEFSRARRAVMPRQAISEPIALAKAGTMR